MKIVISVKVDKEVKDSAHEIASSLGLTLSGLINSYLHHISNTRHIDLYAPEPMTPKMEKIIAGAEAEMASNKISGPFISPENFLDDLKN